MPKKKTRNAVYRVRIDSIRPSPENNKLYRPVVASDPDIIKLTESISEFGLQEPVIVTLDNYILSGHRRHVAAKLAGFVNIKIIREPIRRDDDIDLFVELLREHNRQRVKNFSEKLREAIVSANPEEAYVALNQHRKEAARIEIPKMVVRKRRRSKISEVKQEMLKAVLGVIEELREYLPIGQRQIHYNLLSDPPRRNTDTGLMYCNDKDSSKDLSGLVTRARVEGIIPWDETRPVITWDIHPDAGTFIEDSIDDLLKGYYRDLLQSQPNHFEILVEKNTVLGILKSVASEFTIPITSGRGNSSKSPIWQMVKRFIKSGKEKLVLILLSDFDSDGISITDSVVGYMLHDFRAYGINSDTLHAVRAGLKKEQVLEMDNPPTSLVPNLKSTNYNRFVEEYGTDCWELEAVTPEHLQRILRETICSVVDLDLLNQEIEAETHDAVQLQATRDQLKVLLADLDLPD
jgi:hypothetical protein